MGSLFSVNISLYLDWDSFLRARLRHSSRLTLPGEVGDASEAGSDARLARNMQSPIKGIQPFLESLESLNGTPLSLG